VSYLLDTNVVSELRRRKPDPFVVSWFEQARDEDLHLSVLTVGELRQGIENLRAKDASRARALDTWLAGLVSSYAERIVPVTAEIAERWGELNVPQRLPIIDGLLAATALVNDWALVTRNTKDVERTRVRTVNPFRPSA
jgi:toxin FitB